MAGMSLALINSAVMPGVGQSGCSQVLSASSSKACTLNPESLHAAMSDPAADGHGQDAQCGLRFLRTWKQAFEHGEPHPG